MLFARIILAFYGLSFLVFGVWALIAPVSMARLIHFDLLDAMARTEFRAFYGGSEIALAVLLLVPLFRPEWTAPALILLCAASGSIALSRIAGMVADQASSGFLLIALVWELSAALLAAWAWLRLGSS